MIPLVWLHEIDDALNPAVQETLEFLLHQVPVPVTGIIARQEPAGDDPVATVKWDFRNGFICHDRDLPSSYT